MISPFMPKYTKKASNVAAISGIIIGNPNRSNTIMSVIIAVAIDMPHHLAIRGKDLLRRDYQTNRVATAG
jgi:hypothetical protein